MIGNNIKKLRELIGLTQQKFAERIGIKQNSVALIESNKRNISLQAKLAICREFGVNREWLETGEGEMFTQRNTEIIEQLSADYHLTPKSRELLEYYLQLPQDVRDLVATAVEQAAKLYPRREEPTRKRDEELTREEMHAMLDAELDAQEAAAKRATATSSASTGSSGSVLKFGKSP